MQILSGLLLRGKVRRKLENSSRIYSDGSHDDPATGNYSEAAGMCTCQCINDGLDMFVCM